MLWGNAAYCVKWEIGKAFFPSSVFYAIGLRFAQLKHENAQQA